MELCQHQQNLVILSPQYTQLHITAIHIHVCMHVYIQPEHAHYLCIYITMYLSHQDTRITLPGLIRMSTESPRAKSRQNED
jgi:hypothetical protein